MGTWSGLVGKIEDLPQEPNERTQKLFAQVDSLLETSTTTEIAAILNRAHEAKAAASEAEKTANFDIEAAEIALRKAMERDGLESMVTDGYRFTPKPEPYPKVDDKPALLAWALEHMRDNLALHHKTLVALVKEALESGSELPPGVDVFLKRSFTRTKQK